VREVEVLGRYVTWIDDGGPPPWETRSRRRGLRPRQLPRISLELLAAVHELSGGSWEQIQDRVLAFYSYHPVAELRRRIAAAVAPATATVLLTGDATVVSRLSYAADLDEELRRWVEDGLDEEWAREDSSG
jgi:hypothetical protein